MLTVLPAPRRNPELPSYLRVISLVHLRHYLLDNYPQVRAVADRGRRQCARVTSSVRRASFIGGEEGGVG